MNETETQVRLRRANEALRAAREAESEARKKLNDSVEYTKRCKEKYEELYLLNEKEEYWKRKTDYMHCTN